MAVNVADVRGALPIAREMRAARTIKRSAGAMKADAIHTLIGGLVALLSIVAVFVLAILGKPIPEVLTLLAGGATIWYGVTSGPAVAAAVKRQSNRRE